ncbi:hypothetical protein NDJ02_14920, partial [Vibrio parahaemolyticus]|uniref:hypothetical protein n=1 Tax=Vibrio parahaemolyticus TaxID=670 RepID=UPI00215F44E1
MLKQKHVSLLNTAHTYRSKWCHPLCVQPRWNKLCLWRGEDQLSYQQNGRKDFSTYLKYKHLPLCL